MTGERTLPAALSQSRHAGVVASCVLVFLCAFLLQGLLQALPVPGEVESGQGASQALPSGETPYHIRMAWLYRTGAISEAGSHFHWMRHSIWSDRFVDKDFLYHLFLVPFTLGARDINDTEALITGAKIANCAAFALLALTLFGVLRAFGVRRPWLFTASMLVLGGISFCSRSAESRAWPLYMMCSLLAWLCMAKNSRLALVFVACVFTLSYAAAHFLLILWGLRTVVILALGPEGASSRGAEFKSALVQLAAILGGVALGVALHPGRADFMHTWIVGYVQVLLCNFGGPLQTAGMGMIDTLGLASAYTREDEQRLRLGAGFLPLAGSNMLAAGGAAFAAVALLPVYSAWQRHKPSREAMLALAMGALTLLMFIDSMRFAEVMGPFMALALGIWVEDYLRSRVAARRLLANPARTRRCALVAAVLVLVAAAATWGWALNGRRENTHAPAARTAQWLRDNPRARRKLVWHAQWEMFAPLFFHAPQTDYIVGADPHLLLAHSREESSLICDILENRVNEETLERVIALFGPDYVLVAPGVTPAFSGQCRKAQSQGRLKLAFEDEKSGMVVYEVLPEK